MAEIVNSLFGLDKLGIQQQIMQEQDAMARTIAQGSLTPGRAYVGARIGQALGGALAKGLFGVEDPRLAKAAKLEAAMQQVNSSLTEEDRANPANVYLKLSQTLAQDPDLQNEAALAQEKAAQLGLQYEEKQAVIQAKKAETSLKNEQLSREQKASQALAALNAAAKEKGVTPTTEEMVATIAPFMSIEKLAPMLQGSADKAAYREAMLQQVQLAGEFRIKQAELAGANKLEIESMRGDIKRELVELKGKLDAVSKADKPLSGREARYADNVAIAGNEAIAGINNIINLPKDVTGGFWGAGLPKMQAGTGMFEAPVGSLKNQLTPESVQRYNAEIKNIGKYFSTLRNGGLAATNDDMNSFEQQFRINEGDKVLTALTKLAQMRQTFERAAEIKVNSKNTPKEQVALWEDWLGQVKQAIPLTVNDVNKIANSKDKNKTFKDLLGTAGNFSNIPEAAITKLKADPKLKNDFDAKYGVGAADMVLSK